ncbi:MAG: HD domain-containing protein [Candidatus Aminicenantes bacterium]|nr:HD domain-containing protein [Candidatus Aminicenantes bacterium]
MDINHIPKNNDQLVKYAEDLVSLFKSEKIKRDEIEVLNQQLLGYARDLNNTIVELKSVNMELQDAYLDTIHRLALAAEFKNEDTGAHIIRMSRYSALLAKKAGLSEEQVLDILYAAPMHDIGKIGIPDNILLKPAKLTEKEFNTMKTHTNIGAKILANSKARILKIGQKIAISHHENWNGKGYPLGHSREKISIYGRIVCLADSFDALTSMRPYKGPYPVEIAVEIIKKDRGKKFDPDLVDAFIKNLDEFLKIKEETGTNESISINEFKWSERDRG